MNNESVRCFRVFQTLRSFVMLSKPCQALTKDRWIVQSSCEKLQCILTWNPQARKSKERRKSGGQNGVLGFDGIILTDELKKVNFIEVAVWAVKLDSINIQVLVALNQGEDKSAISPDSLFQVLFESFDVKKLWHWPSFSQGYLESCAKISRVSTAGINQHSPLFHEN